MSEAEQLTIDDYELVNCLATGNASQVWEVLQQSTSQTFAMKLLLDEVLEEVEHRNTMKHEAKVGQSLEHPNIIQIFDSKVTKKQAYIVMELFKAANLKSMIRGSLLNVHARMSKLAESATSAFAYMHDKGWIHKDIKPDNILMTKGSEVRIIDFSLATKPDSALGRMMTRTSRIQIQGTRTYIAPELIKRERLTPSADIYSLGITFYECLTGRVPFTGTNPNALLMSHIQERPVTPSELHKNISPQADALIHKMLAKKPADRYQSMQEVMSELRNLNFFKVDPLEYDKQENAAAEKMKEVTIDQRLDSRSDHEHTQKFGNTPKPKPAPKPAAKPEPEKKAAPAQPAAQAPQQPAHQQPAHQQPMHPGQYQPGQMPPGMYPGMPMQPGMMPPPGYPQMPPGMPGQYGQWQPMPGQHGQPMPGQGGPGQYPGQPMPGQSPMPPQAPPGQQPPAPGQPQSPQQGQPAANQPAAPAPPPSGGGAPQPPPAAPPTPPPAPAPGKQDDDAEPEVPEDIDWLNVM